MTLPEIELKDPKTLQPFDATIHLARKGKNKLNHK